MTSPFPSPLPRDSTHVVLERVKCHQFPPVRIVDGSSAWGRRLCVRSESSYSMLCLVRPSAPRSGRLEHDTMSQSLFPSPSPCPGMRRHVASLCIILRCRLMFLSVRTLFWETDATKCRSPPLHLILGGDCSVLRAHGCLGSPGSLSGRV